MQLRVGQCGQPASEHTESFWSSIGPYAVKGKDVEGMR